VSEGTRYIPMQISRAISIGDESAHGGRKSRKQFKVQEFSLTPPLPPSPPEHDRSPRAEPRAETRGLSSLSLFHFPGSRVVAARLKTKSSPGVLARQIIERVF